MTKPTLNEDQYLQKLNELLKKQDYYKWDMAVVHAPPGSAGCTASGLDVSGPLMPGQLAELQRAVNAEYELVVTYPRRG